VLYVYASVLNEKINGLAMPKDETNKMNIKNIVVSWLKLNKNKSRDTSEIIANFNAKRDGVVSIVNKNMDGVGDKFSNIMMKISIIKLALALVTLIVMTVLLFTHLHVFDPITLHFTKWVTSPIICFIMLVVVIKFVGLSLGLTLTLMSIKQITFENIRLRLAGYCKPGLYHLFRKKVQPQRI